MTTVEANGVTLGVAHFGDAAAPPDDLERDLAVGVNLTAANPASVTMPATHGVVQITNSAA